MEKTIPHVFETFSTLFLMMQKLQYISDRELADEGLTTKQWLMLTAITKHPQQAPSMKEAAEFIATSHQNVKQIATLLQDKGFITIKRDPNDRRSLRMRTTEKYGQFSKARMTRQNAFLERIFGGFADENESERFRMLVEDFSDHVNHIYRESRGS